MVVAAQVAGLADARYPDHEVLVTVRVPREWVEDSGVKLGSDVVLSRSFLGEPRGRRWKRSAKSRRKG